MVPSVVRVQRRRREAPQVISLEVGRPAGWESLGPGQFSMLTVFGVGEVPISLSGDPAAPQSLVHTIRAVGAVSSALAKLERGAALGIRGPFGAGWPMQRAVGRDVILVAGGLGIAPLRPVLYRLLAERSRYGNVVLIYGARGPTDILFQRELETWRRRLDVDIEVTVDHALAAWHGHVGVVTTLIPRMAFDPLHAIAFVCGPEVMMRFAVSALRDAGVGDDAIWLSMERNMKCAVGFCGHCQFGPQFVCRDGPVFGYRQLQHLLTVKEI